MRQQFMRIFEIRVGAEMFAEEKHLQKNTLQMKTPCLNCFIN